MLINSFEKLNITRSVISHQKKINSQGLSLIELLVTICLISIIVGIAGVSFQSFWANEQLRTASDELIQQLRLARMKSILENRSYQIKLEEHVLKIRYNQNNSWQNWSDFRINSDIIYQLSGKISFSGKGFASPKTVYLTKNDQTKKVIVNINGRIRSE